MPPSESLKRRERGRHLHQQVCPRLPLPSLSVALCAVHNSSPYFHVRWVPLGEDGGGRGVKELVSCAVGRYAKERVSNCRASEGASWERLVESELWKCIIGGRGGGKGGEGKHNKKALHIRGKCRKRGTRERVEECHIHPEKRDSECEMQIFSFSSEDSFSFGSIGEAQSVKLARERAKGETGVTRDTREFFSAQP